VVDSGPFAEASRLGWGLVGSSGRVWLRDLPRLWVGSLCQGAELLENLTLSSKKTLFRAQARSEVSLGDFAMMVLWQYR
jgi:hypothetical protein